MIFRDWIKENNVKLTKMANDTGLSFHQLYSVYRGIPPKLKTAIIIEEYTKGEITPRILAKRYPMNGSS